MLPWGFLLALAARNRPEVPDRQGHDIAVDFTLPVCDPCALMHGSAVRSRIAKSLMLKVPPFKELLAYYPSLKLHVTRPSSERGE